MNDQPWVTFGIDEKALALWKASGDNAFRRIPTGQQWQALEQAKLVGQREARRTLASQSEPNPEKLASALGVSICEARGGKESVVWYRATYSPRPPVITIYLDSLEQLEEVVRRFRLESYFPLEALRKIQVAHELFHHLEVTAIGLLGDSVKVQTLRLGPFRLTSGVKVLSEIGANAFAQELLGLPLSPLVLDYLTVCSDMGAVKRYMQENKDQFAWMTFPEVKRSLPKGFEDTYVAGSVPGGFRQQLQPRG